MAVFISQKLLLQQYMEKLEELLDQHCPQSV